MNDYLNMNASTGDTGGGWLSADQPASDSDWQVGTQTVAPEAPPAPGAYDSQAGGYATPPPPAPMAPQTNELSVAAPYLDEVHPNIPTVGGVRGDLSSLVLDVEVPVEVYFGDAALTVEEFLEIGPGSVVELDHAIQTPIELRVRGKLVAKGQLVTINGNYGLRVTEMVER